MSPDHPQTAAILNPWRPFQLHPFTSVWFHVLLNSLFKVLFNFPSRYLFTIGFVLVFSLRWSLPPTLGCIPKQPDSKVDRVTHHQIPTGLTPSPANRHNQVDLESNNRRVHLLKHYISQQYKTAGFSAGLFPVHSPLLRESLLVSFPPLTDMLKFSGYSRLIRGRLVNKTQLRFLTRIN